MHPCIEQMFAIVGAKAPSRKEIMGSMLESLYGEAYARTVEQIKQQGRFALAMDGWKKRAAEHGTPLVTVMVLLPSGETLFWKVMFLL